MIAIDCNVCCKSITVRQKTVKCIICAERTHLTCCHLTSVEKLSKYVCNTCSISHFPFNHITDDAEFLCTMLNFFNDFPAFNRHDLNGPRLSILNNIDICDDQDLNIDHHLYNHYDVDSKYYLPDEVHLTPEMKNRLGTFSVFHINARSLLHKIDYLELLLKTMNLDFDIIAVSETWETDDNNTLINISGYNKCSYIRKNNTRGGGVALFIRESLDFSILKYESNSFESVFVEIHLLNKTPVVIGAIYRPPGGNLVDFNREYELLLNKLVAKKNRSVILAGDFNINLLNHSNHDETENFLNAMYAHKMLPMIKRPTRFGDYSATLIDNIFTNKINESQLSGIILDDISDHLPIFMIMQNQLESKPRFITKTSRIVNETTISCLSDKLNDIDWSILEGNDADRALDIFHSIFHRTYNEALPFQTNKYKVYHGKCKPWITKSLLCSIRKKHKLYKKYLSTKSQPSKELYIKYKNKLTKILRAAEKKYYYDKFASVKENIRGTWREINKLLNDTTGDGKRISINKIKHGDQLIDDSKSIANVFNDYFTNVAPSLAQKIPSVPNRSIYDTLPSPNKNSIFLAPCTPDEIINIVTNLKDSQALDLYGFTTPIIKQIISSISNPLTIIFNKSIEQGIFPQKLKFAKITPVFKADDKLLVSNYRPISVLPVFSKILEKILYARLLKFVENHSILCNNQFGFREKHSTYMALLNIVDHITEQLDSKSFVLGIFIDLSKAFDTIDHQILINKLENYGIRGTALDWFKSYLSDRKQCVDINGNESLLNTITCGVPQGSILGPLLFVIYINDIVRVSSIMKFILFADDTNLIIHDTSLQNLISNANIEIQKISEWLKINKLSLNLKKPITCFFILGRKNFQ